MKLRSVFLTTLASAAAALALAAPLQTGDGDRPEYEFRQSPLNGMGVMSLAELQGKPVLVEFWGTR